MHSPRDAREARSWHPGPAWTCVKRIRNRSHPLSDRIIAEPQANARFSRNLVRFLPARSFRHAALGDRDLLGLDPNRQHLASGWQLGNLRRG